MDNEQFATITTSEGSSSSKQGESGQDSSDLGSSSAENTETDRRGGENTSSSHYSGDSTNERGSESSYLSGKKDTSQLNYQKQDESENQDDSSSRRREKKNQQRVLANRSSAKRSREKRKQLLGELQRAVEQLSQENRHLAHSNLNMRKELVETLIKSGLSTSLPSSLLPDAVVQSMASGQDSHVAGRTGNRNPGGNDSEASEVPAAKKQRQHR